MSPLSSLLNPTLQRLTQGALLLLGALLASFLFATPSFASTAENSFSHTALPVEVPLTESVWTGTFEASEPFNLLSFTGAENWTGAMELRFEHEGEWGPWIPLEEDIHSRFAGEYEAVVTDPSSRFQVQLTTPQKALPFEWAGTFELVNAGGSIARQLQRTSVEEPSVISRAEWGADETLRLIAPEDFVDYPINDTLLEENLKIVDVEYTDEAGNTLNWPLQHSASVTRITVHHTTTDLKHLKDPASAVRSIYYFHTVVRGWGDLGYHYLIAPDGSVYKGRYGDDTVVAAHASGYNVGNIGIVMIGPYHREPIEGAALNSLLNLIQTKAEEHAIDLDATSPYKGVDWPNLLGHRDVGTTLCPGAYLYEHLDELRSYLGAQQDLQISETYTWEPSLTALNPQESKTVTLGLENTGDTFWNGRSTFDVEPILGADILSTTPETLRLNNPVQPGGHASIDLSLNSGWTPGLTVFKITPHWNGREADAPFLVPVFVQEPFVNFELVDLNFDQVTELGHTVHVTAELENNGNVTWNAPSHPESAVLLGQVDNTQVGLDDPYLTTKTLATPSQTVAPGESITVEWDILVDENLANGQLYFHAEMPGVEGSVSSRLHHLTLWTNPENQELTVVDKGSAQIFQAGKTVGGWIQFTNHTDQTLNLADNDLTWAATVTSEGLPVSSDLETIFALETLEAGMSTRVYFHLTAPDEAGEYQIEWIPMQGGFSLWTTPLIYDFAVEG
ncbi:N-acetylmuramoyl-L-alanine amidase [Candidatus Peregrinibacteria bacterium]|nr:MAG: N-acetylmuramoyl-L-alanine amidase [Candidatus Peregrinibacteria bacterium]